MISYFNKDNLVIKTNAAVKIGNSLFFSHSMMNALMQINLASNMVVFVTEFPNVTETEFLHLDALEQNGKIYFVPNKAGCVHVYNSKTNKINIINIPNIRISGAVKCGVFIWLIPHSTDDSLMIINTETDEMHMNKDWNEVWKIQEIYDSNGIIDDFDNVIMVPYGRDYYYKLNKKKFLLHKITLPFECKLRAGMKKNGKMVLSLSDSNDLIVCNQDGSTHKIEDDLFLRSQEQFFTYAIEKDEEEFIVMPQGEQMIVQLNYNAKCYSEGSIINIHNDDWRMPYKRVVKDNLTQLYLPYYADEIMVFCENEDKPKFIDCIKVIGDSTVLANVDKKATRKRIKQLLGEKNIVTESRTLAIEDFIKCL